MSQIFDALLRSETDRAGKDPESQVIATEFLQRVESLATSQWEPTSSHPDAEVQPPLELLKAPPAANQKGSHFASGVAGAFDQFKSLTLPLASSNRLVCLTDAEHPTAEAFRLLGVRLRDLRRAQSLKKILITSTVPREGKSTVAANLACTLAHKAEEKTLLVEGDVRRPSLSQAFDLGSIPGLCDLLLGKRSLHDCIYRIEKAGVWILPAGDAPKTPLQLLQSERLPSLMDQLVSLFDWVIVDSPPILPLADTSVWSRMADGILVVGRQGVTQKKELERGAQALEPGKLIGAILNCSKASTYSSYYYRTSASS